MRRTLLSLIPALTLVWAAAAVAQTPPGPLGAGAPELKPLALEAGTWDADITFPPAAEGGAPTHAKGVQVNTLRSNGMWMLNEFSVDGTPYEGTGLWGWDSATRSYVGTWGDNNENRLRLDRGAWDEATQTLTWTSEMVQADGQHIPLRFTETFRGDLRIFDMTALHPKTGAPIPLVHIEFHRRKV